MDKSYVSPFAPYQPDIYINYVSWLNKQERTIQELETELKTALKLRDESLEFLYKGQDNDYSVDHHLYSLDRYNKIARWLIFVLANRNLDWRKAQQMEIKI